MSVAEIADTFFLDTNILIYAVDEADLAKQQIAVPLVREAILERSGDNQYPGRSGVPQRRPTQVQAADDHRAVPPGHIRNVLEPLCDYFPSISTIGSPALLVMDETGYSLYDALIVTAAIESGCRTLYSEDLQHGRKIQGLTILNPFIGAE